MQLTIPKQKLWRLYERAINPSVCGDDFILMNNLKKVLSDEDIISISLSYEEYNVLKYWGNYDNS